MTGGGDSQAGRNPGLAGMLRLIFPAPFGWHTKYMLATYLRGMFLVLSGVLVIALSIDLAHFLPGVLAADPGDTVAGSALHLGWYIALRVVDQATEFLPLACFLGVLWSEARHTSSRERLIVSITGRAPFQCLAPLVLLAVLTGTSELILVLYLRPVAVMRQAAEHLGSYGERFDRRPTTQPKWLAATDTLLQANIDFTSPPALRDVRLYRTNQEHRLREIIEAKSATPIDGAKEWLFLDGERWTINPDASSPLTPSEAAGLSNEGKFARLRIALDIDPLWLRNFGIDAKYLPRGTFDALAGVSFQPDSEYRTWSQARYAIPVATGAMGIMAGSLSLLLLASEIRLQALLVVLAAGYAAHLLTKLLLLLGDHAWIRPVLAAWLVPVLILACPLAVLQWTKWRKASRQRRLAAHRQAPGRGAVLPSPKAKSPHPDRRAGPPDWQ